MNEESIFTAALEKLDSAERVAFLEQACGDDADLRRRVETMLRAHDEVGGLFRSIVQAADASGDVTPASGTTVARPAAEGPGTVIGPYKLLQQIGQGGMGTVFLAEQEAPVRRKVALKIIRPGMDSDQVIARFEAERQALALMDHPNIAKVFDAGTTDGGRPYFVMELVKGLPITQFCDRNQLTTKERLELFVPVCAAIQHAHQKGVIHRDVKPSNVLVTMHDDRPVPKVIDFGVAKAIEQRLTERTLFTQHGAIVGTLEYMSPEQAEVHGLDIDTRSDIYSLGVLVYELLTGSTPHQRVELRQKALLEILRVIREDEPPKPSSRLDTTEELPSIAAKRKTEPARLARMVRGDLDWIVMKALEKDRRRRYETANGLARDVQRHLADEPVEACPPSRTYRLRKFAHKHRVALTTTAAFAALLVAAVVVTGWLAYRATRAERRARTQQLNAEARLDLAIGAVKKFRDAVSNESALKNSPSLESLRKRLMQEPLEFFKALRDDLRADGDSRPEARRRLASAQFDLATLTDEIGDKRDALRSYRDALAIREQLAREAPGVASFQSELAESYAEIGNLQRAMGRTDEAQASFNNALVICEKQASLHPGDAKSQDNLAACLGNIGLLYTKIGRPADALKSYTKARVIIERLASEQPTTSRKLNLAAIHTYIGLLYDETGRLEEALASHEKAREVTEPLSRQYSSVAIRRSLAASYNNISSEHRKMGRLDEALAWLKKAREIQRRLVGEMPTDNALPRELAASHFNIGLVFREARRLDAALASLAEALEIMERSARANPSIVEIQDTLATIYFATGDVQGEMGRTAAALESFRGARQVLEPLVRDNPSLSKPRGSLGSCHHVIGILQNQVGRQAEAAASYEKAISVRERLVRENAEDPRLRSDLAQSLNNLALIDTDRGRPREGREKLLRAISLQRAALRSEPLNAGYKTFLRNHWWSLTEAELQLRHPVEAARAAREWAALVPGNPDDLYNIACYLSKCAALDASSGANSGSRAAKEGTATYADQAMSYVTHAIAAGWKDWGHTAADPDLRLLHGRREFQRLVFDRIFPAQPFAKEAR